MPKITTVKDLRDDLLEEYASLKRDPRRLNVCAELSNTAGKILASAKLELEYAKSVGAVPNCEFMKYDGSISSPAKPVLTEKSEK